MVVDSQKVLHYHTVWLHYSYNNYVEYTLSYLTFFFPSSDFERKKMEKLNIDCLNLIFNELQTDEASLFLPFG